jgi:Uma2 family endonuclease
MPAPAASLPHYTWNDYQSWPDGERWEIIGGVAYNMSPAPSTRHQVVAGNLFGRLLAALSGKPCRPFIAPIDVKLSDFDVVQPDILVVCDPGKITPSHIEGAPDLVIEVLSPTTALKDLREKKALYQRSGVGEYLVIHPLENYLQRFLLGSNGRYGEAETFGPEDRLALITLPGVDIALWEIFDLPAPGETSPAAGPVVYRD